MQAREMALIMPIILLTKLSRSTVSLSHFINVSLLSLRSGSFITNQTYRRRTPFQVIAAKGMHNFYEGLHALYKEWIELEPDLMNLIELDNQGHDQFADDTFLSGMRLCRYRG